MKILFLGDIVGRSARNIVRREAPALRRSMRLDFIIANAENASGGLGLNTKNAVEIKNSGIDVLTGGNHTWRYKEIYALLDNEPWLLRPANYPPGAPGRGWGIFDAGNGFNLAVVNLQGRIYMDKLDCPFRCAEDILSKIKINTIIIDFHAEATSEKRAMLQFLRGRISALIGTHTHVQTNDVQIVDRHTGYITDGGMCGVEDSVIGMDSKPAVKAFVHALPQRFEPATGEVVLHGVVLDIDDQSGTVLNMRAWKKTFDNTGIEKPQHNLDA